MSDVFENLAHIVVFREYEKTAASTIFKFRANKPLGASAGGIPQTTETLPKHVLDEWKREAGKKYDAKVKEINRRRDVDLRKKPTLLDLVPAGAALTYNGLMSAIAGSAIKRVVNTNAAKTEPSGNATSELPTTGSLNEPVSFSDTTKETGSGVNATGATPVYKRPEIMIPAGIGLGLIGTGAYLSNRKKKRYSNTVDDD